MTKRLQAEIWEIQIILYWILAVLIHVYMNIGWLVGIILVWSFISFIGVFIRQYQGLKEEGLLYKK